MGSSAKRKVAKKQRKKKAAAAAKATQQVANKKKWTEKLEWEPILLLPPVTDNATTTTITTTTTTTTTSKTTTESSLPSPPSVAFSVISWNVLADAYCSRRSQRHLPKSYQDVVFARRCQNNTQEQSQKMPQLSRRLHCLVTLLKRFINTEQSVSSSTASPDQQQEQQQQQQHRDWYPSRPVFCLQEVDDTVYQAIHPVLRAAGYVAIETPRCRGGRVDSLVLYVPTKPKTRTNHHDDDDHDDDDSFVEWEVLDTELISLDDLATLCTSHANGISTTSTTTTSTTTTATTTTTSSSPGSIATTNNNLQGLQQSFLRRNAAMLVRLRHVATQQTVVLVNLHLYWHPGYDYVKLCQVHYILQRTRAFVPANDGQDDEPVVVCGDFNARPGGAVHAYLTKSVMNAKLLAPWYPVSPYWQVGSDDDNEEDENGHENEHVDNPLSEPNEFRIPQEENYDEDDLVQQQKQEREVRTNDKPMSDKEIIHDDDNHEEDVDNDDDDEDDDDAGSGQASETDPVPDGDSVKQTLDHPDVFTGNSQTSCTDLSQVVNGNKVNEADHVAAEISRKLTIQDTSDETVRDGKLETLPLPTTATATESSPPPQVRYLLDATLNKLCRWLRILGQDCALETDEEEKQRTKEGNMVIFQRCRHERRTLVTTSTRLMLRKDCPPGTYCINPTFLPHLEVAMIHLFLTYGVVLEPATFLTRCVVCNGAILLVHDPDTRRAIYQAPNELAEEMEVFQCNGCQQGYWWCDRPTSSASRVKNTATRLFVLCLRAGVPIRGELDTFDYVDVAAERQKGWDMSIRGSELLAQKLDVVEWLKNDHLECPFQLQSVYAVKDSDGNPIGESLPFTNVTHDFVDTLDYILFTNGIKPVERLYVPKSFEELNRRGIKNGHLLPSDIWPSDHLAIGCRFRLEPQVKTPSSVSAHPATISNGTKAASGTDEVADNDETIPYCAPANAATSPPIIGDEAKAEPFDHGQRCACGCVPKIRSLFEMAELRRQAKKKQSDLGK